MPVSKRRRRLLRASLVAAAAGSVAALPAGITSAGASPDAAAHAMVAARGGRPGGGSSGSLLLDHGGSVLPASKYYTLWWGSGSFGDATSAVPEFLSGLNNSNYLGIAQQYMRTTTPQISTTSAGSSPDTSAPPTHSPSVSTVVSEVANAVGFAKLDPSVVYLVYTSNFPKGANYCAWHSYGTVSSNGQSVTIQVAYLPNVTGVLGCQIPASLAQPTSTASLGTQALIDDTAHEFMETVTDPNLSAWYDQSGNEIGDKCQTVYSNVSLTVGPTWTLQKEWSNSAGGCTAG